MRREAHALVEAVRALRLALTGKPAPRCVTVGASATEFPERLAALQRALETLDATGGALDALGAPEDMEKLRKGVDGIFRWIKLQGLDTAEPLQILTEALTGRSGRRPERYEMLPKFTPYARRDDREWKPAFTLGSSIGGNPMSVSGMGPDDHRVLGRRMEQVSLKMGGVMPTGPSTPRQARDEEERTPSANSMSSP